MQSRLTIVGQGDCAAYRCLKPRKKSCSSRQPDDPSVQGGTLYDARLSTGGKSANSQKAGVNSIKKEHARRKDKNEDCVLIGEVEEQDSGREELNIWDLPGYVAALCAQDGYEYGVQFCKQVTKSKRYRLNARLRCLRYKYSHPGCGCKAAFMAKARRDEQGWLVSESTMHNHERVGERRRSLSEKRKKAVREAILKNCPGNFRIPFINYTPPALKSTSRVADTDEDDFVDDVIPSRSLEVQNRIWNTKHVDDVNTMSRGQ
ncbi:hypothetical protein FGB62_98g071 [Gracilaria domingensis]|nr:hypothetical protein FGB62_98g071 [Gracilaria domingensis]